MTTLTAAAAALCILTALRPATAGPAMLFDAATGTVFYAEDVDQIWHPASLTKLMTAYVTFKALKDGKLKLDETLTVGDSAVKMPPSKLGLKSGETISVDLAIKAMVVKSANDMAVTIAQAVAGSEQGFTELMNTEAVRLGMTKSHYANASGLPNDEQLTSARDLAILTRALIRDFPDQAYLFSMASVRVGNRDVETHNTLLKTYDGADGMKTGFICDSGYNIIASATREGHRLIAVVLGEQSSASRNVRAAAMLDFGFQNYLWKTMFGQATIDTIQGAPTDTATAVSLRQEVSSCVPHVSARSRAKGRARRKGGNVKEAVAADSAAPAPSAEANDAKTPIDAKLIQLKPSADAAAPNLSLDAGAN